MTRFRILSGKQIVLTGFILCMFVAVSSEVFAFWKKEKRHVPVQKGSAETDNYRIFYKTDPEAFRKDDSGKGWNLLFYKVVNLSGNSWIAAERDSAKIRFLDADGFALASDLLPVEKLKSTDFYGNLWIEEDRGVKIANADIVGVTKDELEIQELKKRRLEEDARAAAEAAAEVQAKLVPSPKQSSETRIQSPPSSEPSGPVQSEGLPEAKILESSELPEPETKKFSAPAASVSAPRSEADEALLGNQGTTTEDVQQILNQLNKKNSLEAQAGAPSPSPS